MQILGFYYNFLDKYLKRQDLRLQYTDSFYLITSGDSLDEIKLGLRKAHEADKKNGLATNKRSEKITGIFKPEFVGIRGVWLGVKYYFIQNQNMNRKNKYSYKDISEKHHDYISSAIKCAGCFPQDGNSLELKAGDIDKTKNIGFRVYD